MTRDSNPFVYIFSSGSNTWHVGSYLSSLTRDWTHAPCSESTVLTTGPPGKSLYAHFLKIMFIDWLSEEALQIAVKRREAKSKGEKERHTHLNADFPRIARRDKKAFLSNQCKEIEENNRMGKTRALVKKIRDTKGTFHAKMGSIGQKWYGPNRRRRY